MKTTHLIYAAALLFSITLISCSGGNTKQAEQTTSENTSTDISNLSISPERSKVMWAGEMLGVYTHTGTLQLTSADLKIENGKLAGGSFTVDMNSMMPTDENYNPEEGNTPEKLVGHLSSPDFFDVVGYPTAKFIITEVMDNVAIGNLTLRGKTNEEKVENITISEDNGLVTISGMLVFDRKKYDVAWDYPVQEMVLSDDVEVKIELIGS